VPGFVALSLKLAALEELPNTSGGQA
jgi:hypothetical protein